MSPRKAPYRLRYKFELKYPSKEGVLVPSHGSGPRCDVSYNPDDDGPWTTVQIMRIDNDDVENYICLMPRYYAIPLILINKQLAFYEAQCRPDGTPLPPSSSCKIKQRELREYSYLWALRCRFLQAVFEMNHNRVVDERFRYDGIHGFLHRMYRRFGHDTYQRVAYWREEIKKGRVPYSVPDIADMDWQAYLYEETTSSTRIHAFLWNHVSQGYTRVVKDKPPFESWRAWRAGHRVHKPMPYLTPASSPVHEPPSELDGVSAAAVDAVAEQAMTTTAQGSSSNCGAGGGYDTTTAAGVRTAVATAAAAAPRTTIQATAAAAATAESATAGGSRRGVGVVVAGNGSGGDEETEELEYEDVKVLTADLMVQRNSQGWALSAFPSSSSSSQQSQLSSSSDGGPDRSMSTNTNSQERLRENKISFKYNAPENLELAVIQCIFTKRMEDVNSSKEPRLEVTYKENLS